jgi:uncharacterized YccA/Bax inhibitor family protein
MMRTANPALNAQTFVGLPPIPRTAEAMTLQGTVNRTAILLGLVVVAAGVTWNMAAPPSPSALVMPLALGGAIGGFIAAIVTAFKKEWAPVTAPIYAVLEGLFLGAISAIFEMSYPGIVVQAVGLTFGTLGALLLAYRSGLIKATENFRLGVVAATGGIALMYLASMVLGFFGVRMSFLHDSGPLGVAVSLFVVVVAALNLVLDFDFIENGSAGGAPKFMEWYAAFGLMVTLIWLYLEMLRLLAKLRDRR